MLVRGEKVFFKNWVKFLEIGVRGLLLKFLFVFLFFMWVKVFLF